MGLKSHNLLNVIHFTENHSERDKKDENFYNITKPYRKGCVPYSQYKKFACSDVEIISATVVRSTTILMIMTMVMNAEHTM